MKHKGLIISIVIFFLLINTSYYWEGNIGFWAFPSFFGLIIFYLTLIILFLRQLYYTIKERFADKQRLFVVVLIFIALITTSLYPKGLINFEKFEGKDLLVAQGEGAANCMTTLKLKDNNKFTEKTICFGIFETKGSYELKGDTVFFSNVSLGRNEDEYYKFAIVNRNNLDDKQDNYMIRYKNYTDTIGYPIRIIETHLPK
jgi:hypothetical protein